MQNLNWQRPAAPGAACHTCGQHARLEFCTTGQHEPSDNAGDWRAFCSEYCAQLSDPKAMRRAMYEAIQASLGINQTKGENHA